MDLDVGVQVAADLYDGGMPRREKVEARRRAQRLQCVDREQAAPARAQSIPPKDAIAKMTSIVEARQDHAKRNLEWAIETVKEARSSSADTSPPTPPSSTTTSNFSTPTPKPTST